MFPIVTDANISSAERCSGLIKQSMYPYRTGMKHTKELFMNEIEPETNLSENS